MAINYKRVVTFISLVVFTSQIAPYAYAGGTVVTPPKTQCFIEVGNAHLSTSIRESSGKLAVKVNAISRCNVPQSKVTLTVKIFKVGAIKDHLVANESTRPSDSKSNGLVVKNQSTYAYCINSKESKYYGVAYSRAYIHGKLYVAPPVWTEKPVVLKCGT